MKELKIYSVDEIQEPLLLRLACNGGGGVALIAVNGDGVELSGGRLITLTANGPVCLHQRVSKHLELPLDDKGRLRIAGREDKTAVTFSDDELISITRMRDKLLLEESKAGAFSDAGEHLLVLEKMIEALNLPMSDDDEE